MTSIIGLDSCCPGKRVRVLSLAGDESIQKRLAGYGIRRGMEVTVESGAAQGTTVLRVMDSRVALGHGLAGHIRVRCLDEGAAV